MKTPEAQQEPSTTRPAGWRNRTPVRLAIKLSLYLLSLLLLYIVGMTILRSVSLDALQHVRRGLNDVSAWFLVVRWVFIGLLALYWTPINRWFAARKRWSEGRLQHMLSLRWQVFGVLLFVELVFVLQIYKPLITWINQ